MGASGLHAVLTAVGTITLDYKKGLVVFIRKGKKDHQECNYYLGITLLTIPGKVLDYLLLMQIYSQLKSTHEQILALRV